MTNIPNPLILVKRNTFSLNGWIKFHSKKFSLQKKRNDSSIGLLNSKKKKKRHAGRAFHARVERVEISLRFGCAKFRGASKGNRVLTSAGLESDFESAGVVE